MKISLNTMPIEVLSNIQDNIFDFNIVLIYYNKNSNLNMSIYSGFATRHQE